MTLNNRPLRILLNGKKIELTDVNPTESILEYLRTEADLTGTKEGCAEGDCGACTIVLGELFSESQLRLRSVNACLLLLPMLDGKAIFTVEYLRQANGSLHPAQQAMVDFHGSQCGFCTPGFVMSLWSCFTEHQLSGTRPTRKELTSSLTGNLCRCTGYRPILDAAEAMFDLPAQAFDSTSIIAALNELHGHEPLQLSQNGITFHAPRSMESLKQLRAENSQSTVLAGCTDIGIWVNKQFRNLEEIVYLGEIPELKKIRQEESKPLRIGATVSLDDAYAAAARHYPELNEIWERFASKPIRSIGTLGGNIANGSPIGDSMPWLIALGSMVELTGSEGISWIPLERLYAENMNNAPASGNIVSSIEIPLPVPQLHFRTYKIAKRHDSDISAVCAAFALWIDGSVITQARVAFGGMAAKPSRAVACEAALINQEWDEETAHNAMKALCKDFTPIDDMRASASYRIKTAHNLLYRYFIDTRQDPSLPAVQTGVFNYELPQPSEAS